MSAHPIRGIPMTAIPTEAMIEAAAKVLNERLAKEDGLFGVSRDMLSAALSSVPPAVPEEVETAHPTDNQVVAAVKAYISIEGKCRPAAMRSALAAALSAGQAQPVAWRWTGSAMADLDNPDHWSISTRLPPNIPDDWKKEALYSVPPAVPVEVHAQLALIKHLAEYTTEKNWDDKRLYIMQAVYRALSVPPEIEGGDKGDGWQPIETAPKNWTDVLLFDPGYRNDHRKVFEGYFEAEMEIWCDAGCEPVSPTHWRPLPAAPSASIEGETP